MGQPKQLLHYQGRTLLRQAAETALATGCQPLVLVTGALHEPLIAQVQGLPFVGVHNPDWATGMGSSIQAGMAALEKAPQQPAAVLIMLCDQPLVTPNLLLNLIEHQRLTQAPVVASAYSHTLGVPAVFGADTFPALRQLGGAEGARHLIASYGAAVEQIPFPGGIFDVDTPAQYVALLENSADNDLADDPEPTTRP
jgi:molybdenum cofactor cytidylyltransferase